LLGLGCCNTSDDDKAARLGCAPEYAAEDVVWSLSRIGAGRHSWSLFSSLPLPVLTVLAGDLDANFLFVDAELL